MSILTVGLENNAVMTELSLHLVFVTTINMFSYEGS